MEYIVFGVPNGFCDTGTTDEERKFIEQFYRPQTGKKMFIHKRFDHKVFYTYAVYAEKNKSFCSFSGRSGSFLGLTVILDKQYCQDFNKIKALCENMYTHLVSCGLITEDALGNKKFMTDSFGKYDQKIEKSFASAVQESGLSQDDMKPFVFEKLKGTYRLNPVDAAQFYPSIIKLPYNMEISENFPTQAFLKKKASQTL